MKKIKKPNGKELAGSAGIAFALYTGALALNHEDKAEQASTAAVQYEQEADVAGESGAMKSAFAAREMAADALRLKKTEQGNAGAYSAIALVALGVGLDAFSRQAKVGAEARLPAEVPRGPEPDPQGYMDDATQEMPRVVIPVPRPTPPQYPPVLQKR